MILVDIGNSTIHFGVEQNNRLIDNFKVSTIDISREKIRRIIKKIPHKRIVICSVVPKITPLFEGLDKEITVIGKDVVVPIRCVYNKKQVGQDRLLNAYAAKVLFPESKLIIDFGTAITLDFISKKGDYLGGFIFPGLKLSYHALGNRCALLPKNVKIDSRIPRGIPKNTQDSINKGILEGVSGAINAWVRRYKTWLVGGRPLSKENIVITGGEAKLLLKSLYFPYKYEPNLILKGMIFLINTPRI
jgi:type III pantothenate kinase